MKFDFEQVEARGQAQDTEGIRNIENRPPKFGRGEEIGEQPPKLAASGDFAEYFQAKREQIQEEMDAKDRKNTIDRFEVNYGTPTTEGGWKHEAEEEYGKWGKETPYYNYCMEQAVKAHVSGK